MTVLIPRQPVTLKGSSACLCSLLAPVTLVPLSNTVWASSTHGGSPASALRQLHSPMAQGSPRRLTACQHSKPGGPGDHCESGALNLSGMGVID